MKKKSNIEYDKPFTVFLERERVIRDISLGRFCEAMSISRVSYWRKVNDPMVPGLTESQIKAGFDMMGLSLAIIKDFIK